MLGIVLRIKLAIDVILFSGTTVVLAVLAQNEEWWWFGVVATVCIALYALLRAFETKPVLNYLEQRTQRETRLTTALDQFGIRDLYNMQVDAEAAERNRVTADLIESGNEFSLSGSTGASYLDPKMHRHWPHVRAKLAQGSRFRLLLTNPYCEAKSLRNTLNGVTSEIDPKLDLANLQKAMLAFPQLEVRFTDEVYCSVFFTERDMVYDPYHLGQVYDRLENRFFALRLHSDVEASGASYYQQLKNHFDYLWEHGERWQHFAHEHPHLFVDNPPRAARDPLA